MTRGIFACFLFFSSLQALTIEEKKVLLSDVGEADTATPFERVTSYNRTIGKLKESLKKKYCLVNELYQKGNSVEKYEALLKEVNTLKKQISGIEKKWRDDVVLEMREEDDGYSLWDQEETVLSNLVMEFGSSDYLYIIPPEMASMKLMLHSGIPIPRESWNDLLEIVLAHNGIGVKQLNPFTKQLFILKQDLTGASSIATKPEDLERVPTANRVIYLFTPDSDRIKNTLHFFERFRDPKMTSVYQVGYKIAIISKKEEITKLLYLYDSVWKKESEKISRIFSLTKLGVEEMEKILVSFFGDGKKTLEAVHFKRGRR